MNERIRQEAEQALKLTGLLNVSGDAVDVMAAVRQALRGIMALCAVTPAGGKGDGGEGE